MKRTYLISGVIVLAIAALVTWIARNTYWEAYDDHGEPQGEALTNPFYAAQRFSSLLGASTQTRHDFLHAPPPRGVVVLGEWNWNMLPERRERLQKWVANGGRLVVSRRQLANDLFDTWTGVRPEQRKGKLPTGKSACKSGDDCPVPELTSPPGIQPVESFEVCELSDFTYLQTTRKLAWRLNDSHGHPQAVRIPIGLGSVTIINTEPFEYQSFLCDDSPRLFVAATHLRRGTRIDFISEGESSSLLALAWRYGWPVIVLSAVLVALWLWRSGARFGPLVAVPDIARRSLAEQIRGTGQFTLRFGGGRALYAATLRALNEAAARRVPQYERLTDDQKLAALGPLTGLGTGELSAALANGGRSPHELRKAIAVLETARRQIATAAIQTNNREGSDHAD